MKMGMKADIGSDYIVLDEDPSPPQKNRKALPHRHSNFLPMSVVAKQLDRLRCHFGMEVGFAPGDTVLDEDPAPPPKKKQNGHISPHYSAHVCCGQAWTNMPFGTEEGLGPGHIVLDGDSAPLKRGTAPSPQFSAHVCWDQTAGWMKMPLGTEVGLVQRQYCVRSGPSPLPKTGAQQTHHFSARVYCGQSAGWTKMPFGTEIGLSPGHIVLDGDPAPPRKGTQQPPLFAPCLLWPNGRPSQLLLSSCFIFIHSHSWLVG